VASPKPAHVPYSCSNPLNASTTQQRAVAFIAASAEPFGRRPLTTAPPCPSKQGSSVRST
jgi:hypothetical protein